MVVTSSTTTTATDENLALKDYWRSKLPNTRMPKAIQADLLTKSKKPSLTGNVELVWDAVVASNNGWGSPPHSVGQQDDHQLSYDQISETLYFLENELHPGSTMNLHFTKTTLGIHFLPRKEAEAIPFSSKNFSNVLQRFSVLSGSNNAQVMKNTISDCEKPASAGEEKYCATSLESMIDFSCSKLGTNNVQVLSTEEEEKETSQKKKIIIKKYRITGDLEKMKSEKAVLCHGMPYMYAVFYCHTTRGGTRVYKVPLVVDGDGTKAHAIAVCHMDTSKWSPNHLAFQLLKIKPGNFPVCHFLMVDHVVWVPNM
ncbi:BURP domain-containing protein 3-like [Telopea speciosissima]|uniref:BURP domain-containing protein 3-like n=1 Tax=Telopea speciosissima TaxID=54955 RepID=UPI001CC36624|nr:BURP domain-containing protein 3-like [Telopea speciosissima]